MFTRSIRMIFLSMILVLVAFAFEGGAYDHMALR
jgi:hypothetical protein